MGLGIAGHRDSEAAHALDVFDQLIAVTVSTFRRLEGFLALGRVSPQSHDVFDAFSVD